MTTTVNLHEAFFDEAKEMTGITERTVLLYADLRALI